MTVNEQLVPKLELQLTAVTPTGKNEPDGGEQVGELQIPTVVIGRVTFAPVPHLLKSLFLVTFAGQLRAHVQEGAA